jgi:hypothetical protein
MKADEVATTHRSLGTGVGVPDGNPVTTVAATVVVCVVDGANVVPVAVYDQLCIQRVHGVKGDR